MTKKYRVPVSAVAQVSKHAGYIECDSFEEFEKLLDEKYDQFIDSGHISTNISNDFEVSGDTELNETTKDDLQYYKN